MWKKLLKSFIYILSSLIIIYFLVVTFLPSILDKKYHTPRNEVQQQPSKLAVSIYKNLPFIGDLHSDALLWKRNLLKEHEYGQIDLPRMKKAGMDLQIFTVVSKTPRGLNFERNAADDPDNITYLYLVQGRPLKSLYSLKKRVEVQAKTLQKIEADEDEGFKLIRAAEDLIELEKSNQNGTGLTAGLLGLEGAHVLEGDIRNVQEMFDLGVRMVGFTHFFDNELGGSGQGVQKGGITEFGLRVLEELEKRNMIIDLAHASDKLFFDVIKHAKSPLLVSHTGIIGTDLCLPTRNLSDEKIKAIAHSKGIIGIAFLEELICSPEISTIAKQMKYVSDLVGVEHVAMGSDSDGSIPTIISLDQLPLLVDELLKLEFSEQEIALIMGENVKKFLIENLPQ